MKQIVGLVLMLCCTQMLAQEVFPDGKIVQTKENTEVIDLAAQNGGGELSHP